MTSEATATRYEFCCSEIVYSETPGIVSSSSGVGAPLNYVPGSAIMTLSISSWVGNLYGTVTMDPSNAPRELPGQSNTIGATSTGFNVPRREELQQELDGWLKLSSHSFDFWDNDEDAVYDNL